jgi:hypothetical protein
LGEDHFQSAFCKRSVNVRFALKATEVLRWREAASLLDHLVGAGELRGRHVEGRMAPWP